MHPFVHPRVLQQQAARHRQSFGKHSAGTLARNKHDVSTGKHICAACAWAYTGGVPNHSFLKNESEAEGHVVVDNLSLSVMVHVDDCAQHERNKT